MATAPAFIATPRYSQASVSSANTAVDGSGTITSLITGAATGTRVLEIDAQIAITGASTASIINLFLSVDGGSTWKLFDQITLAAATGSTSVKSTRNIATYANLILPSASYVIGCTTTIAQATNVIALGGDL